jgi:YHS domain-containing protein
MENLTFERVLLKYDLAFKGYCPVTWKLERKLVMSSMRTKTAVKYRGLHYFFESAEKRDLFISNPTRFLDETTFSSEPLPKALKLHEGAEQC